MDNEFTVIKDWTELEEDFKKRKTNVYACINGGRYIKVDRKIPEEISNLNGVLHFHYCKITKIKENHLKETLISDVFLVSEEVMKASEFIEENLTKNETYGVIQDDFDEIGDFLLSTNSYEDEDGNINRFYVPVDGYEEIIMKPKTKRLIH